VRFGFGRHDLRLAGDAALQQRGMLVPSTRHDQRVTNSRAAHQ
jgi:hypothetical protein